MSNGQIAKGGFKTFLRSKQKEKKKWFKRKKFFYCKRWVNKPLIISMCYKTVDNKLCMNK